MGVHRNISDPINNTQPPSPSPQPPSLLPQKPNVPMLYYALAVVATAALVLAVYNLIIVRWCTTTIQNHRRRNPTTRTSVSYSPPSLSRGSSTVVCLVSSFKYDNGINKTRSDYNSECSVCLSVFEEGEEVRKLPMCGHCFHASCIDMWLHSHFDCPLCRAPVVEPPPPPCD